MLCILFANITYGCNCMAVVSEASQLCVYVQCEALHYKLVAIEPQNGMECEHMMLGVDIDSDWHTYFLYMRMHAVTTFPLMLINFCCSSPCLFNIESELDMQLIATVSEHRLCGAILILWVTVCLLCLPQVYTMTPGHPLHMYIHPLPQSTVPVPEHVSLHSMFGNTPLRTESGPLTPIPYTTIYCNTLFMKVFLHPFCYITSYYSNTYITSLLACISYSGCCI